MSEIFTSESLLSLIPLTLMEILLGIDNVIFVSIVLSRLDKQQTKKSWLNMDDSRYFYAPIILIYFRVFNKRRARII